MADPDWWRSAVIYQIYPMSFCDADGDGIGDLEGVTSRLDHVADLGVDAIWLSPFFRSPLRDFGYDVADYRAVDPVFGTLADFDRLLARAHGLGLKVLIDQVWSHSSDEHPWFRESRADRSNAKAAWYVWADPRPDGTPPNNWLSVFGGPAWQWEPRRRQYYLHHFLAGQPQLNLRHPEVVEALLDAGAFWLERGVDGFRLDAVDFYLHDPLLRDNPASPARQDGPPVKPFAMQRHRHDMMHGDTPALLARMRGLTDRFPGTALLGEVSSQPGAYERVERYTAGEDRLHMAYTLRPMRGAEAASAIGEALAEHAATARRGTLCWAFSNHDAERAASRWSPAGSATPDPAFIRLLATLLLSLGGPACLYQGEELGLPEARLAREDLRDPFGIAYYPEFRGRDGSRTPMPWSEEGPNAGFSAAARPWLPVPAGHRALSVAAQARDPGSPLQAWRELLAWRRRHGALLAGGLEPIEAPRPLLAFAHAHGNERMVVVLNPAARPARMSLAAGAASSLLQAPGFAGILDGDTLLLPPYGTFIATTRAAAIAAA